MFACRMRSARTLGLGGALLLGFALLAQAHAQSAKVGAISDLVGEVEVLRHQERFAGMPGTELRERDVVVTGEGSWASIALSDGSELAIGGSTTLVLNEYVLGDDSQRKSGVFSLLVGIVRALVGGGQGGFVIDTQAAVASARSTDFLVEAKDGHTAVFVQEGQVVVSGVGAAVGQRVTLEATEGTDVDRGQAPTAAKVWGQARVDAAIARTRRP